MLVAKNAMETNKYELEVKVDAESFEKALNQAFMSNRSKIQVPGFRKGKAPRKMIERMYGEEVFFEDAINASYSSELADAVKEAELDLVDRPDVEIVSVSKEDGYVFKAICIVRPEVEVTDYKGIKAEKTVNAVTDEQIDAEIDAMRQRNARIITIEDRASQMGDDVVFDFDGYVDGEAFEGGKAEAFSLTLGSGQFIPGFEEQMVDRKPGDEFDVEVTFPENYHAEELKGKLAVFKCKAHEIKGKELPELDDEFAKDVSEFDTLDELKADLRKKAEERNEKAAEEALENTLVDKVIENMKAEIPEVMFENRVDESVQEFAYRLQSQGMSLDLYLNYSGMDMDSFRKTFREQAEKQVKIRLALEKIVELEGLKATEEDLDAEYARMADAYKMEVDKVKEIVPAEEISQNLAVGKAIDLIKETAVVKEAAAKKPAAKKTAAKKADDEKTEKKPAAKKPAAKKPATKKADGETAAKKPAAKKPAAKKPAAKKEATKE